MLCVCLCLRVRCLCPLQESTDELYLIPAIDMLNHSTDPSLRNTSLALCHGDVEVELADGQTKRFTNFFSMKAGELIVQGLGFLGLGFLNLGFAVSPKP